MTTYNITKLVITGPLAGMTIEHTAIAALEVGRTYVDDVGVARYKILNCTESVQVIPPWTTFAQAVVRSKSEILELADAGVIPRTCANYSELHDYVDANGFGGAFDYDWSNEHTDFWNAVQIAVSAWIKDGFLMKLC